MTVRKIMLVFAAFALVVIGAGCGTIKIAGQPLGGESPTPTRTRVTRPTFTPIPPDTDTPTATITPTSTSTPIPATATATRKPVIVPTRPPATATQPLAPTAVPPTTNPYTYQWMGQKCLHSGGTYLIGYIFSNFAGGSGTPLSGIKTRASYAPDGPPIDDDIPSDDSGKSQHTLSGNGPRPGTWYLWVVDNSGRRISPLSQPIVTNDYNEDKAGTCWLAQVAFAMTP